jgi:hypothetical protein
LRRRLRGRERRATRQEAEVGQHVLGGATVGGHHLAAAAAGADLDGSAPIEVFDDHSRVRWFVLAEIPGGILGEPAPASALFGPRSCSRQKASLSIEAADYHRRFVASSATGCLISSPPVHVAN